MSVGEDIHRLARTLWPINRSLTGEGLRETLAHLQAILPDLTIHSVPSGTPAFDWTVPKEWHVRSAFIQTPSGERICDFSENNLHLMGYSTPVDTSLSLAELQNHLYSLPEQPDAIPYITSYYKERWGFCLSDTQRRALAPGEYRVYIDSALFDGVLNYGELLIPGEVEEEILLSTYVCHPSMANNELSGPCVTTFIAKWIMSAPRRHSFRIVFVPETIGSIVYLSRNLDIMKNRVVSGFNVTCIGDDRAYSFLPSRNGSTISDRVAKHVLESTDSDYRRYTWLDRGSDERQYCAPGIDLPIASIMRTKYAQYDEYHTSLDDLENVVTPAGLEGGYSAIRRAIEVLERNCCPKVTVLGEPQMGKRGLYPTLSTKKSGEEVALMMNFITLCDGQTALIDIAEQLGVPAWELYPILDKLVAHHLLELY